MTPWEENRNANIARNRALLVALGLDEPFFEPKQQKRPKKTLARKRKASTAGEQDRPAKAAKPGVDNAAASAASGGLRRSGRNAGKTVNYNGEAEIGLPLPVSVGARASLGAAASDARKAGKRIHDPKVFGSIPGVEVGTWWETREACSADAIHAPWVAGISGNSDEGAYSVCLSGGYEDDVDLGYGFTYTGSGGRDLKGTKNAPKNLRTAPQSSNQTFENSFNKALKASSETGRPVRVVRGYKLKSKYAPVEGYRYDGLYKVEKAWLEPGLNEKGFLVCKFAFKRLPGQSALEIRGNDEDELLDGDAASSDGASEA